MFDEIFSQLDTASFCDAFKQARVLSPDIKFMNAPRKFWGRACTVENYLARTLGSFFHS